MTKIKFAIPMEEDEIMNQDLINISQLSASLDGTDLEFNAGTDVKAKMVNGWLEVQADSIEEVFGFALTLGMAYGAKADAYTNAFPDEGKEG